MAMIYPLDYRYFRPDEHSRCSCNATAIMIVRTNREPPSECDPRCEDHIFGAKVEFTIQWPTNGIMRFRL